MKIKKIYNYGSIKNGELDLSNDEVMISLNGEEFTELMTALAISKLNEVKFAGKLYKMLCNCEIEENWKE